MKDTINFNKEVPNHDSVASFYLRPIGKFEPWKYVDPKRLDEILKECYRYGTPTTRNKIEAFYETQKP